MTSTDHPAATQVALQASRRSAWRKFLLPQIDRWFLLRLALVAGLTYLFFGYVCVPARIRGRSMEPAYRDGTFMFCWRPRYWVHPPRPGNVVMIRVHGLHVLYLNRVVATEGDTVEFRSGRLWVNGHEEAEPYVVQGCDWSLAPRTVPHGHAYVVGDNRTMPIEECTLGAVPMSLVEGGPIG